MISALGHRNPGGTVFGAEKSDRSLQCATRGGACEYACVRACARVARPGWRVLLQSVSMTRRSRAPQAARGGD